MTTSEPLPAGPSDLSTGWLTDALRKTGTITDETTVSSFELEAVGEGAAFLGQLTRVRPTYDRPTGIEPKSMVAKFPTTAKANRDYANLLRFYEREMRFYEELAGEVTLRTPKPYFASFDPKHSTFVLLMEELYEVGDQVLGCPPVRASDVLGRIARFHASWWDSSRLASLDWIPHPNSPLHQASQKQFQLSWPLFLEKFGPRIPEQVVALGERLQTKLIVLQDELSKPPLTICHGDLRYDNLFFGSGEIAVADWHVILRSRGGRDTGYFMSQSLNPDDRKACELRALRHYHDTLTEHGVRDYGFDECFDDYRKAALERFLIPVLVGGRWDLANERGLAMVTAVIESRRACAAPGRSLRRGVRQLFCGRPVVRLCHG